jgi:dephospho-CoA kinase
MKIIGISGVATSGKDTLCSLIARHLSSKNIKSQRLALADNLKNDLKDFICNKFDINILEASSQEKTLIRPIMVAYGKVRRTLSKGKHWTNMLDRDIEELTNEKTVPIITDIRYMEYPEDEFFWLKSRNGILVHISRLDINGNLITPANLEEKENDIKIKEKADLKLIWETEDDTDSLYYNHLNFLKTIYEQINL